MDVAGLLRGAREDAGLSRAELAAICDVPRASLSAYEAGRRTPPLPRVGQILAALGLRLELVVEPLPVQQWLAFRGIRLVELLALLGDLACVIDGACAAALQGAPVPQSAVDLVLLSDQGVLESFTRWAARNARRWDDGAGQFGPGDPDPRSGPSPARYETRYGELRLRLAGKLPESVAVEVGGLAVQAVPLHRLSVSDARSGRVIERVRQRLASQS